MSIVLHIDTAVQASSICITSGNEVLATKINLAPRDAASWLHVAINDTLKEKGLHVGDINAVAISAGPGSYTGLRVGMSAAKGLCYALDIPLITINTLEMMARSAGVQKDAWLCPMIDARRMEVFTALYDESFQCLMPSTSKILDEDSFSEQLNQHRIMFFGNGNEKFRNICKHPNAVFCNHQASAFDMITLAAEKLKNRKYADLAYTEPFYGKDFHSIVKESL